MLKVGLTGGIGSGKTTVAKIFEVLGVPVYSADEAAKKLMNEDDNLKQDIIKLLGQEAYVNEKLNKAFVSTAVFTDVAALNKLNALVHPATLKDAESWIARQTYPYIIKEAAILFESGSDKFLDKVIGVSAPLELRISRLQKRNHYTREEIMKRMNNQMEETEKMNRCDFVIINDEMEMLLPQILSLHQQLLKLAGK